METEIQRHHNSDDKKSYALPFQRRVVILILMAVLLLIMIQILNFTQIEQKMEDINAQLEARLSVADSDISALQPSRKKSEGKVEETSIVALQHEIKSLQYDKEALGRQLTNLRKSTKKSLTSPFN
jgi:cell shape-determining protein MreC